MEEAFAAFFFAFCKGFVAEVSDFVKISNLDETLRFSDDTDSFNAFFTVNFAQIFCGNIKNAALANVDFFFGGKVKAGYEAGYDS